MGTHVVVSKLLHTIFKDKELFDLCLRNNVQL